MRMLISTLLLFSASMASATHMDVSGVISDYTGAASCVVCHSSGSSIDVEAHARAVTQSAHFAFKSNVLEGNVYEYDGDTDLANDVSITGDHGKINRYCGLPGSIAAINWLGVLQPGGVNDAYPDGIPGGCARCHVSNGTLKPSMVSNDDAWQAVDCMLCHAETYQLDGQTILDYGARLPVADATSATGFHMPYLSGADLSVTSQSITASPSTSSCQNCHAWAGGGYTNKRGHDYDGARGSSEITDIHSGSLSCVDCHVTRDHKISMGHARPAAWTNDLDGHEDNEKITCEFCHSADGQAFFTDLTIPIPAHEMWGDDATMRKHMDTIACQTCHTTENGGLDFKYFDQIKRILDGEGNFVQWKPKGHKLSGSAVLSYQWFNGTVYDNVSPRGERGDGKIHPFRVMQSYVPVDDATGIIIPVKLGILFSADSLIANMGGKGVASGDSAALIDVAIRTGAKLSAAAIPDQFGSLVDGAGDYTGSYSWEWDVMNFAVDHGTNAAAEALSCNDCHSSSGGRLDWAALGYAGDPVTPTAIETGAQIHRFELRQNSPNPFNPTTAINYSIGNRTVVTLSIYNVLGQLVETVIDRMPQAPGEYALQFDASGYASGVYIYRLETPDFTDAKRFTLVR